MEDLEIFDKQGNKLNLFNIFDKYLINNLSINVSTDKQNDEGYKYTRIYVSICLKDEEICSNSDIISHN